MQPLRRCWLNHLYDLRASASELGPMLTHACPAGYSSTANPLAWAIIWEMTQLQASTSQPCTPPSLSPLLLKGKTAPNHHPVTNTGARSAAVCVSSKLISRPNLLRRKTSGCSTSPLYFCKSHQYTVNNTCLKASLKPA